MGRARRWGNPIRQWLTPPLQNTNRSSHGLCMVAGPQVSKRHGDTLLEDGVVLLRTSDMTEQDELRVQRTEEELRAGTRERHAGAFNAQDPPRGARGGSGIYRTAPAEAGVSVDLPRCCSARPSAQRGGGSPSPSAQPLLPPGAAARGTNGRAGPIASAPRWPARRPSNRGVPRGLPGGPPLDEYEPPHNAEGFPQGLPSSSRCSSAQA